MDRINRFDIINLGFRAAVLCLFLFGSLVSLLPGA